MGSPETRGPLALTATAIRCGEAEGVQHSVPRRGENKKRYRDNNHDQRCK
jgi:hypothetical protein